MSTRSFIHDLASLLLRYDDGMLEFEEPPPHDVEVGLMKAIMAFGDACVPILHETMIEAEKRGTSPTHIIDLLGELKDPTSVAYLIYYHQHYGNHISSLAAIQALRNLKVEEAYVYLGDLLVRYAKGDDSAVQSRQEIVVACEAMGEWHDQRALIPLQLIQHVEPNYMAIYDAANKALMGYS